LSRLPPKPVAWEIGKSVKGNGEDEGQRSIPNFSGKSPRTGGVFLLILMYMYPQKTFVALPEQRRRKGKKRDFICRQTSKSELPFTFELCAPFVDCFAQLPCQPKSRQHNAASGHRKSQMEKPNFLIINIASLNAKL